MAHEIETRVEVTPSRVAPGTRVELSGSDLAADLPMRVELLTAEGPLLLAEARTDADGALRASATVPDDTPARYYEVHVVAETLVVAVGYLEVTGADSSGTEVAASSGGLEPLVPVFAVALLLAAATAVVASLRGRQRPPRAARR